jgi:hypothetical protein
MVLFRLVDRIDRVLFVAITLPIEIKLIKSFIQKPTEKKFFEILATPFIGYFGGRIAKEVIKGFLGSGEGISIPTVPTIPTPPNIPSLQQRYFTIYDGVNVSDEVSVSFIDRYITQQITETPVQFTDNVSHSLTYNILGVTVTETPIQFVDDVSHTLTYNILGVTITETPVEITDDVSHSLTYNEISIQLSDIIYMSDTLSLQLLYMVNVTKYDGRTDTIGLYNSLSTKYDGRTDAIGLYNSVSKKYDGYTNSSITP